jgi:hypothetical protein
MGTTQHPNVEAHNNHVVTLRRVDPTLSPQEWSFSCLESKTSLFLDEEKRDTKIHDKITIRLLKYIARVVSLNIHN